MRWQQFRMRAAAMGMLAASFTALAMDETLISSAINKEGTVVPYILNTGGPAPRFVVILFPGGNGNMNPRMEDGKLVYDLKGNFLIRARNLLVDEEFASVATNSSQSEDRIQAILDDLKRRFPNAQVYLMGTSNGTYDTLALAGYLSDRIAGEIHTSSRERVASFDARRYKNRHLLVHHKNDGCHVTPFSAAERAHEKFGDELIVMEGGVSKGDPCLAWAYHGFNGIEADTIARIKEWIIKGDLNVHPERQKGSDTKASAIR